MLHIAHQKNLEWENKKKCYFIIYVVLALCYIVLFYTRNDTKPREPGGFI